jgi:hypothetical protein
MGAQPLFIVFDGVILPKQDNIKPTKKDPDLSLNVWACTP